MDCKKKIFTLDELRNVIDVLEQNKIDYYVFGGFALEAISKLKKNHGDLDLIVNKNDKDTLTNVLERYKKTTLGRLVIYKREEQNLIYKIGILWMKAFKDFYKIKGNRTEDIISRKDFNEQNYVSIEDVSFRIMPFEWFSLYANCNHHCKEKADYHKEAIMSMLSFCKEMKILEQRPIKRLKSDPYYQE